MSDLTDNIFWNRRWKDHGRGSRAGTFLVSTREHERVLEEVVSSLAHGAQIIELGAAPGLVLLRYHAMRPDLTVDGVDISEVGIELAQELFKENNVSGTIYLDDFRNDNSLLSEKYDLVCSHGLIEHFDDFEKAIHDHFKYVKSGGRIYISIPNYSPALVRVLLRFFSRETLETHNFDCMKQEALRRAFEDKRIGIEVIGAYGGPVLPHSVVNPGLGGRAYSYCCRVWNAAVSLLSILSFGVLVPRFWNSNLYVIATKK